MAIGAIDGQFCVLADVVGSGVEILPDGDLRELEVRSKFLRREPPGIVEGIDDNLLLPPYEGGIRAFPTSFSIFNGAIYGRFGADS